MDEAKKDLINKLRAQKIQQQRTAKNKSDVNSALSALEVTVGHVIENQLSANGLVKKFSEDYDNITTYMLGSDMAMYVTALGEDVQATLQNALITALAARQNIARQREAFAAGRPLDLTVVSGYADDLNERISAIKPDIEELGSALSKWNEKQDASTEVQLHIIHLQESLATFHSLDGMAKNIQSQIAVLKSKQAALGI